MRKVLVLVMVFCLAMTMVFANAEKEVASSSSSEAWTPAGGNVSMIVPYGVGGSSDQVARIFASSKAFKDANIVVENVPGGGCAIGLTKFVQSKADGFTIGNTSAPMIILPITTKTQPYVYYEKVIPICRATVSTFAMFVRADSNIKNLDDLKAEINKREVILAANSRGGNSHWETEYFAYKVGGDVTTVFYDGGASSIAALLGGHADVTVQNPNDGREYVRSGDLRCIAVLGEERLLHEEVYKDVPTTVEQGYPWLINHGFQGYSLPAGCPDNVVEYYNEAFKAACQDPEVIEKLAKIGYSISYLDKDGFAQFVNDMVKVYKDVFTNIGERLSE